MLFSDGFDCSHSNQFLNRLPQFIIMVIDSTDRERLAVTREELYRMLQHEDLSKANLLVYANKQVCLSTRTLIHPFRYYLGQRLVYISNRFIYNGFGETAAVHI